MKININNNRIKHLIVDTIIHNPIIFLNSEVVLINSIVRIKLEQEMGS
jgi:hypothetical protein